MTEKINITENRIEIIDEDFTVYFDFYTPIDPQRIDAYLAELREQLSMKKSMKPIKSTTN